MYNNEKKVFDLQELINLSFGHWTNNVKFCENCKKMENTHTKILLNSLHKILILKLEFSDKKKKFCDKKKGLIKSVPKAKISLCNKKYQVVSAIFHSSKNNSSHYIAMIKQNSSWIQVDDKNIQSVRWPMNSKGAYIFVLEEK